MGDFGADANPDVDQANILCHYMRYCPTRNLKFDQWSIDTDDRVQSFHDGTGHTKLFIRYNPLTLPPA